MMFDPVRIAVVQAEFSIGLACLDPAERRGLQTIFFSMMQERRKDLYALKREE